VNERLELAPLRNAITRFAEGWERYALDTRDTQIRDRIRTGSEQGLLRSGWDRWRTFRQARTDTSHTYDEVKALKVVDQLPDFLIELRHLLAMLEARNG